MDRSDATGAGTNSRGADVVRTRQLDWLTRALNLDRLPSPCCARRCQERATEWVGQVPWCKRDAKIADQEGL